MAYTYNGGSTSFQNIFIIPPTTDLALVFPLNHESKKYDKSFYSSALTHGRASEEQIERFLSEVEDTYKNKLKWLRWLKGYLVFSLVMGLITLLLYTFAVVSNIDDDIYQYDSQDANYHNSGNHHSTEKHNLRHHSRSHHYNPEEDINILCIVWFGAIINSMIWSGVFQLVRRYSLKKARIGVQAVVDRNQAWFASSGLRWNLPLAFPHYIELWKDYRGHNYNQESTQNVPNHNCMNYNQAQAQAQVQIPNINLSHKYPNLNQVSDVQAYFNFQTNEAVKQALLQQGQRNENNYVPPYTINM